MRLSEFDVSRTTKLAVEVVADQPDDFNPEAKRRAYRVAVDMSDRPTIVEGCVQLLAYAAQLKLERAGCAGATDGRIVE